MKIYDRKLRKHYNSTDGRATEAVIDMAQAMASLGGLRGASDAVLVGTGSTRLIRLGGSPSLVSVKPAILSIKAQQEESAETSRRAMLSLAATVAAGSLVPAAFADGISIKVGPPPPPSGGLSGTLNSDEARDLRLPLRDRFYLQPLSPSEAAKRAKESAKEIVNVKSLIAKKAWPYVQNDLRLRAEYLRYDLNTVITAKPRDEKKGLMELTDKLFQNISNLDYAAKKKSSTQADKYYADTISTLNHVLGKLG